jgi:hypothetical protein
MKHPKNVTLHILDKDYVGARPEREQDDLLSSFVGWTARFTTFCYFLDRTHL